jgi:hypothetical protein
VDLSCGRVVGLQAPAASQGYSTSPVYWSGLCLWPTIAVFVAVGGGLHGATPGVLLLLQLWDRAQAAYALYTGSYIAAIPAGIQCMWCHVWCLDMHTLWCPPPSLRL